MTSGTVSLSPAGERVGERGYPPGCSRKPSPQPSPRAGERETVVASDEARIMTLGFPLGLLALARRAGAGGRVLPAPPPAARAPSPRSSSGARPINAPRPARASTASPARRSLALEVLAVLFAALFLSDVRCGQTRPNSTW